MRACSNGDVQDVKGILSRSAALSSKDVRSSLQQACEQGHLGVVQELINQFPNEAFFRSDGKTALQVASHRGHLDIVQFFLAIDAHRSLLDIRDDEGDSALHYAAYGKKLQVMEFLLSRELICSPDDLFYLCMDIENKVVI